MMKRSKEINIRKAISLFTAVTFLFTNTVVYAGPMDFMKRFKKAKQEKTVQQAPAPQGAKLASESSVSSFVVPENVGRVKDTFEGKSGKTVIHIQDAHCNFEAQSNIVKIIQDATEKHNVKLIGVEGSTGEIDTSLFTTFPDKTIREEVSTYFMRKGKISGAEYFAINAPGESYLYGVENREHYLENLKAFQDSLPLKEEAKSVARQVNFKLQELKASIYSPELKKFDAAIKRYESGKTTFTSFVEYLQTKAVSVGVDTTAYKNFTLFLKTIKVEEGIDFEKVDGERTKFIEFLDKVLEKEELSDLFLQSLYYKLGQISANAYYSQIKNIAESKKIHLDKFPALKSYIGYLALYNKVDNRELFRDITSIEDSILEKMFKNDAQARLARLSKHIQMVEDMIDISMANDDMNYYFSNKDDFTADTFSQFLLKQFSNLGLNAPQISNIQIIDEIQPTLNKFYKVAEKRDDAIIRNLFERMKGDKEEIAVLVTGGYHTEGLTRRLKNHDVSYVVVSPRITKEDYNNPYLSILSNQRTPFEQLLAEGTIAITSYLAEENFRNASEQQAFVKDVVSQFLAHSLLNAYKRSPGDLAAVAERANLFKATWIENLGTANAPQGVIDSVSSISVQGEAVNIQGADAGFYASITLPNGENFIINLTSLELSREGEVNSEPVLNGAHTNGRAYVSRVVETLPQTYSFTPLGGGIAIVASGAEQEQGRIVQYADGDRFVPYGFIAQSGDCGAYCWVGEGLEPQEALRNALLWIELTEHRGYDSEGLVLQVQAQDGSYRYETFKTVGGSKELRPRIEGAQFSEGDKVVMITAHTRWATHGVASEPNQHPTLRNGPVGVVFNGIVDNMMELDEELAALGNKRPEDVQTDAWTIEAMVARYYGEPSEAQVEEEAGKLAQQEQQSVDRSYRQRAREDLTRRGVHMSLQEAVQRTMDRLEGDFAFWAFALTEPATLVTGIRGQKPQVIGYGGKTDAQGQFEPVAENGNLVVSEPSVGALAKRGEEDVSFTDGWTRPINSGQVSVVTPQGVTVYAKEGDDGQYTPIEGSNLPKNQIDIAEVVTTRTINVNGEERTFPYFTEAEIYDAWGRLGHPIYQERAEVIGRRADGEAARAKGLPDDGTINNATGAVILGMGTAKFAGDLGKQILDMFVGRDPSKPFEAQSHVASEYYDKLKREITESVKSYRRDKGLTPLQSWPADANEWVEFVKNPEHAPAVEFMRKRHEGKIGIAVSQSGSTQDTNEPVLLLQALGMKFIGMVNKPIESTLVREADFLYRTKGGVEVGVASTKAFVHQLYAFYQMAIYFGLARGTVTAEDARDALQELEELPQQMTQWLTNEDNINHLRRLATKASRSSLLTVAARGIQVTLAEEGKLKTQELTGMKNIGTGADTYKHGPITSVRPGSSFVGLMIANTQETATRIGNEKEITSRFERADPNKEHKWALWKIIAEGDEKREEETLKDPVVADSAAIVVPKTRSLIGSLFTAIVPIQLLAVFITEEIGKNGRVVNSWSEELFSDYFRYSQSEKKSAGTLIGKLGEIKERFLAWTDEGRFDSLEPSFVLRTQMIIDAAISAGQNAMRLSVQDADKAEIAQAQKDFAKATKEVVLRLRGENMGLIGLFNELLEAHDAAPDSKETLSREDADRIKEIFTEATSVEDYTIPEDLPLGERDLNDPFEKLYDQLQRELNRQLQKAQAEHGDTNWLTKARAAWEIEASKQSVGKKLGRNIDKPKDIAKEMTVDALTDDVKNQLAAAGVSSDVMDEVFRGVQYLASDGRVNEFRGVVPIISQATGVPESVVRRRSLTHERIHFLIRNLADREAILVALDNAIENANSAGLQREGLGYTDFREQFENVFGEMSDEEFLEEVLAKYFSARISGEGLGLFADLTPHLDSFVNIPLEWSAEFRQALSEHSQVNRSSDDLARPGVLPATLGELFTLDNLNQFGRSVSSDDAEIQKLIQLTTLAETLGQPLGISIATSGYLRDQEIHRILQALEHDMAVIGAEAEPVASGAEASPEHMRALGINPDAPLTERYGRKFYETDRGTLIGEEVDLTLIDANANIDRAMITGLSTRIDANATIQGSWIDDSIIERNAVVTASTIKDAIVRRSAIVRGATVETVSEDPDVLNPLEDHLFIDETINDVRKGEEVSIKYELAFALSSLKGGKMSTTRETAKIEYRVRTEIGEHTLVENGALVRNSQTGQWARISGGRTSIQNSIVKDRAIITDVRANVTVFGVNVRITGSEVEEAYFDDGFTYEERVDEDGNVHQSDSYLVGVFPNKRVMPVWNDDNSKVIGYTVHENLSPKANVLGSRIVVADYPGESSLSKFGNTFDTVGAADSSLHLRGGLFPAGTSIAPSRTSPAGALSVNNRLGGRDELDQLKLFRKIGPRDNSTGFAFGSLANGAVVTGRTYGVKSGTGSKTDNIVSHPAISQPQYFKYKVIQGLQDPQNPSNNEFANDVLGELMVGTTNEDAKRLLAQLKASGIYTLENGVFSQWNEDTFNEILGQFPGTINIGKIQRQMMHNERQYLRRESDITKNPVANVLERNKASISERERQELMSDADRVGNLGDFKIDPESGSLIHRSAIIEDGYEIGKGVIIGPGVTLSGKGRIGDGSKISFTNARNLTTGQKVELDYVIVNGVTLGDGSKAVHSRLEGPTIFGSINRFDHAVTVGLGTVGDNNIFDAAASVKEYSSIGSGNRFGHILHWSNNRVDGQISNNNAFPHLGSRAYTLNVPGVDDTGVWPGSEEIELSEIRIEPGERVTPNGGNNFSGLSLAGVDPKTGEISDQPTTLEGWVFLSAGTLLSPGITVGRGSFVKFQARQAVPRWSFFVGSSEVNQKGEAQPFEMLANPFWLNWHIRHGHSKDWKIKGLPLVARTTYAQMREFDTTLRLHQIAKDMAKAGKTNLGKKLSLLIITLEEERAGTITATDTEHREQTARAVEEAITDVTVDDEVIAAQISEIKRALVAIKNNTFFITVAEEQGEPVGYKHARVNLRKEIDSFGKPVAKVIDKENGDTISSGTEAAQTQPARSLIEVIAEQQQSSQVTEDGLSRLKTQAKLDAEGLDSAAALLRKNSNKVRHFDLESRSGNSLRNITFEEGSTSLLEAFQSRGIRHVNLPVHLTAEELAAITWDLNNNSEAREGPIAGTNLTKTITRTSNGNQNYKVTRNVGPVSTLADASLETAQDFYAEGTRVESRYDLPDAVIEGKEHVVFINAADMPVQSKSQIENFVKRLQDQNARNKIRLVLVHLDENLDLLQLLKSKGFDESDLEKGGIFDAVVDQAEFLAEASESDRYGVEPLDIIKQVAANQIENLGDDYLITIMASKSALESWTKDVRKLTNRLLMTAAGQEGATDVMANALWTALTMSTGERDELVDLTGIESVGLDAPDWVNHYVNSAQRPNLGGLVTYAESNQKEITATVMASIVWQSPLANVNGEYLNQFQRYQLALESV